MRIATKEAVRRARPAAESSASPLFPPILATVGAGAKSAPHAHHALHLVLALAGEIALEHGGRTERCAGVVTPPDVRHAIDGAGVVVALVFADPESDAGGRLAASLGGAPRTIDTSERDALLADLEGQAPAQVMAWGERALDRVAGVAAPRAIHPRVRRVLRALREAEPGDDVSLARLAELAGLSESRLVHVFRESIGIPLRPYVLWLKLQRAVVALASGLTLPQAAAAAGFADAAHMSRTFRRMFGMTPSALRAGIEGSQSVQDPSPGR